MASSTVTVNRILIEKKRSFLASLKACWGDYSDKVIKVSHSGDATLEVTEKNQQGQVINTFTVPPGGVHVERLGDSVPFEDMMERIDRWTFSYADGRKVKLNKAVTRTREGDSAAAGLAA
ncbi:hypothetical protein D9Q98_007245 [Chlorella vulgaris]|uniref:Uncharacterized protein n=1 Tax=Chlorella vulgaris TaxID=3077 RepID=A0A9D4TKY7_CHLVU|nr:hypothetical protein D9Q98_007245 [Chlorella vulgaris]